MMTEAEVYEFDLNGLIVYRNMIPPENVARMNELIDADQGREFPQSFSFLHLDPLFMNLMAHPKTLDVMRTIIGDWMRLDHTYGLQMTNESEVREICTAACAPTRASTNTSGPTIACGTAS